MQYRDRSYSLIFELQKLGVDQCIVISWYQEADLLQQKAVTIKRAVNRWVLMDSAYE